MSNVNKGVNQVNILFWTGLSVGANILQFIRNTDYENQAGEWKRKYERSEDNYKHINHKYSEYFHLYHLERERVKSFEELAKIEEVPSEK